MATTKKKNPGISTEAAAIAALVESRRLNDEVERLMTSHGISEKIMQSGALKKAACDWAVKNKKSVINLPGGVYFRLRCDKYGGQWISTDDDLTTEMPVDVKSVYRILREKFKAKEKRTEVWMRITRRTVDPEKLARAVADGVLTADEIAPAYYEKDKAPFLIGYGG